MRLSPTLVSLSILGCAFALCPSSHAQQPVNNAFASATLIVADPATGAVLTSGTTLNATKEAGEPNHALSPGGASIWFRWVAPRTEPVSFDLAGTSFDSVMGIYTGVSIGALDLVIFNDDGDQDRGVGVASKAVITAVAGTTYHIAVDGFPDATGTVPSGAVSLQIASATPPPNDTFAAPIDLGGNLPLSRIGDPHRDATTEPGEPPHGGYYGFGTTWYNWTAPDDGAAVVKVGNQTTRPSLVAVYTGSSLGSLIEVSTAITGSGALVPTREGTTYRIAVVGLYSSGAQTRGEITLLIERADTRPLLGFGFGEAWSWLHPTDGSDPSSGDADFASTWHQASAAYDGPAFNPAAPAPLGYGTIAFAPVATDIGTPAAGQRFSAYFVRGFTLADPISHPVFEVLADDGAIIYLDGIEAGRVNVTGSDTYRRFADDPTNTEDRTYDVPMGPLAAGDHTVGVSLHNVDVNSSDLGFDLRVHEGLPYRGEIALGSSPLCTGFQDPPPGSALYLGRSLGDELGWSANAGGSSAFVGGDRAFEISDLTAVRLETERVDVSNRQNLIASVAMRTVDTSSGLENSDFLHVFVEGSNDGLTFRPVADVFPLLLGADPNIPGDPDPFEMYRSETNYTTFTSEAGAIPDGLVSVRIVVEGAANSSSEHIIVDQLCISAGPGTIRVLGFSASPESGVQITVSAQAGNLYELQSSTELARASSWATVASDIASSDTLTLSLAGPLSDPDTFFRVVNFGED